MKVYLEAVNPVYRRRRIAKVLQRARFYKKTAKHWGDVANTIHKKNVYGLSNAEAGKIANRYVSAEDSHFHYLRKYAKALSIGQGRYELQNGDRKHRLVPSNPLRKGRDETWGKHQRDMKTVLDTRKSDKLHKLAKAQRMRSKQ